MNHEPALLDRVRIASPCAASWKDMEGDNRVRYCKACKLNVYNFSAMTRAAAEALILEHEGRLCATFYQRLDGSILTADCHVGLSRTRRKLFKSVAALVAVFFSIFGVAAWAAPGQRGLRLLPLRILQPFAAIYNRFAPPIQWAGAIAIPSIQTAASRVAEPK